MLPAANGKGGGLNMSDILAQKKNLNTIPNKRESQIRIPAAFQQDSKPKPPILAKPAKPKTPLKPPSNPPVAPKPGGVDFRSTLKPANRDKLPDFPKKSVPDIPEEKGSSSENKPLPSPVANKRKAPISVPSPPSLVRNKATPVPKDENQNNKPVATPRKEALKPPSSLPNKIPPVPPSANKQNGIVEEIIVIDSITKAKYKTINFTPGSGPPPKKTSLPKSLVIPRVKGTVRGRLPSLPPGGGKIQSQESEDDEEEDIYDDIGAGVEEPDETPDGRPVSMIPTMEESDEEDKLEPVQETYDDVENAEGDVKNTSNDDDEDIYEDFDENQEPLIKEQPVVKQEEIINPKEKKKREEKERKQREKEEKERNKKAKKEQEDNKKKEKELKSKFKFDGDPYGTFEMLTCKKNFKASAKYELVAVEGQRLHILRRTDNPKPEYWLVKTDDGKVGYIESNVFEVEEEGETYDDIERGSEEKPGVDDEIYEAVDD